MRRMTSIKFPGLEIKATVIWADYRAAFILSGDAFDVVARTGARPLSITAKQEK